MSSKRDNQELIRAYNLLGQALAKKIKILGETACMDPETREMIGYIDAWNMLNKEAPMFQEERSALIELGRAKWIRKELTDLALAVGDETEYGDYYGDNDKTD